MGKGIVLVLVGFLAWGCGTDGGGSSAQDVPSGQDTGTADGGCVRDCQFKQCGSDGCGGFCGTCLPGSFCSLQGLCVAGCQPDCVGKQCGFDGCGGSCGGCPQGQACQAGTCVACVPSCVGIECGDDGCGGSCGTCPPGASCVQGNCSAQAQCNDGAKNGTETDIDCGGPGCPGCAAGKACQVGSDCASGMCNGGTCEVPSQCKDGKKNGNETDADCGGGDCPGCALGKYCIVNADCLSAYCYFGICEVPDCNDGVLNGLETDKDCGGNCPPCPNGKNCLSGADCQTAACVEGTCAGCVSDCSGKECGGDGCGGSCGTCPGGFQCEEPEGQCVEQLQGACTGASDTAIIYADPQVPIQATTQCAISQCFGELACMIDCLVEATGLSEPCAECYALSGVCGFQSCMNPCLTDPEGAECWDCMEVYCMPDFYDCSGLPPLT